MHKMAILLGLNRQPKSTDSDDNDGSESKDGDSGYEMFMAWCEAMGITPKDPKKAYNRMCALYSIWNEGEGSNNGGY